jgi:hypothetical protein
LTTPFSPNCRRRDKKIAHYFEIETNREKSVGQKRSGKIIARDATANRGGGGGRQLQKIEHIDSALRYL